MKPKDPRLAIPDIEKRIREIAQATGGDLGKASTNEYGELRDFQDDLNLWHETASERRDGDLIQHVVAVKRLIGESFYPLRMKGFEPPAPEVAPNEAGDAERVRSWRRDVDLFGSPMARAVRLDETITLIDLWFRLVELRGQRPSAEMHLLMTLIREGQLSLYEKAPGRNENLFIPISVNATELEIVFVASILGDMRRDGCPAQELGTAFIDSQQAKQIASIASAIESKQTANLEVSQAYKAAAKDKGKGDRNKLLAVALRLEGKTMKQAAQELGIGERSVRRCIEGCHKLRQGLSLPAFAHLLPPSVRAD